MVNTFHTPHTPLPDAMLSRRLAPSTVSPCMASHGPTKKKGNDDNDMDATYMPQSLSLPTTTRETYTNKRKHSPDEISSYSCQQPSSQQQPGRHAYTQVAVPYEAPWKQDDRSDGQEEEQDKTEHSVVFPYCGPWNEGSEPKGTSNFAPGMALGLVRHHEASHGMVRRAAANTTAQFTCTKVRKCDSHRPHHDRDIALRDATTTENKGKQTVKSEFHTDTSATTMPRGVQHCRWDLLHPTGNDGGFQESTVYSRQIILEPLSERGDDNDRAKSHSSGPRHLPMYRPQCKGDYDDLIVPVAPVCGLMRVTSSLQCHSSSSEIDPCDRTTTDASSPTTALPRPPAVGSMSTAVTVRSMLQVSTTSKRKTIAMTKTSMHRPCRGCIVSENDTVLEGMRLAMPNDEEHLNSVYCFIRSELLELFVVWQEVQPSQQQVLQVDVSLSQAQNKSQTSSTSLSSNSCSRTRIPRVGLRCVYCERATSRVPAKKRRPCHSLMRTIFPTTVAELYPRVILWYSLHVKTCPFLSPLIRQQLNDLQKEGVPKKRGSPAYWIASAHALGLQDYSSPSTPRRGIVWVELMVPTRTTEEGADDSSRCGATDHRQHRTSTMEVEPSRQDEADLEQEDESSSIPYYQHSQLKAHEEQDGNAVDCMSCDKMKATTPPPGVWESIDYTIPLLDLGQCWDIHRDSRMRDTFGSGVSDEGQGTGCGRFGF
jgi:hypothetical protein